VIVGILIDLLIEFLTWAVAGIGYCLGVWLFKKWKRAVKARAAAAAEAEAEAAAEARCRAPKPPPKRRPRK
jgi:hypothetical protein